MPITRKSSGLILFEAFNEDPDAFHKQWKAECHTDGLGSAICYQDAAGYADKSARCFIQYDGDTFGALTGTLNLGSGAGRKFHIVHKTYYSSGNGAGSVFCPFNVIPAGDSWYPQTTNTVTPTTHDWFTTKLNQLNGSIPDALTGSQTVTVAYGHAVVASPQMNACVDSLTICKSDVLTITSLTSLMKVEAYGDNGSGGIGLIDSDTLSWGETQAQLTIDGSLTHPWAGYPSRIFLKIYQADGTLFETTPYYQICGGDVWDWNPATGTLSLNADPFIIYRQASLDSPKTTTVTASLMKPNGDPYAGKTITFKASLGSISPLSAVTDTNGQAVTTFSSSGHGVANARADWAGDTVAPAARAFLTIHVFQDAEVPDPDKPFQFFNQGIEFPYTSGEYSLNGESITEPFKVILPEWSDLLVPDGLVSIYRKGVKEFGGVLKVAKRTLGSRSVELNGSDASVLLADRVLDVESFPDWYPQDIIPYLLGKFATCITAGSINHYPDTVSLMFSTEDLRSAIQRLCTLIGWTMRINSDLTLDFAESFGRGVRDITFTEGINLPVAERTDDCTAIANVVHMKGDHIKTVLSNTDSIYDVGVHEITAFQSMISVKNTLNTACAALLAELDNESEQITVEAVDTYDVGSFLPEEKITMTSPTLDMAGGYVVKRIHRDMTDAQWARLELTSRKKDEWEYDTEYQRMVKDSAILAG